MQQQITHLNQLHELVLEYQKDILEIIGLVKLSNPSDEVQRALNQVTKAVQLLPYQAATSYYMDVE